MLNCLKETFTVYKTPKLVPIKSKFLAITYFALVLTVWICYLGSYQLDVRKVYQKTCKVTGSAVTKTKGAFSTENLTKEELGVAQPELYQRVWDNSDLVFVSHGGSKGLFLATNLKITPNQKRGKCPEVSNVAIVKCGNDSDCPHNRFSHAGHGVLTGKCLTKTGVCEVSAWCPIENDDLPLHGRKALLEDTQHFTIMIKNSVEFPDCGSEFKRRNILKNSTKKYLTTCLYDKEKDKHCPIFKLKDIVEWSNQNFSQVAITGGIFQMDINWNCDFDWGNGMNDCLPTYSFSRADDSSTQISPGWNFRTAIYEGDKRKLTKYYGFKILVTISGEGKRFDFLTLVLSIGATIGFFSVAPLVCDLLLDLFSKLKKCSLFHKCLSQYSAGARVEGHKQEKNQIELSKSNATITSGLSSAQALA